MSFGSQHNLEASTNWKANINLIVADKSTRGERPGYDFQLTGNCSEELQDRYCTRVAREIVNNYIRRGSYGLLNMPQVPSYIRDRQQLPLVSTSSAKQTYLNYLYGFEYSMEND